MDPTPGWEAGGGNEEQAGRDGGPWDLGGWGEG